VENDSNGREERQTRKSAKDCEPATCDGERCRIRELRANIRSDVTLIVGADEAATLYGGRSDLSATFIRYTARVCELCQVQFATTERPARDELCRDALRACVGRMLSAHNGDEGPIRNLPAYLNGEIARCTELGDLCGDDTVEELRRRVAPPRDPDNGDGELEHIEVALPDSTGPENQKCPGDIVADRDDEATLTTIPTKYATKVADASQVRR
jgi:hypothetical protein